LHAAPTARAATQDRLTQTVMVTRDPLRTLQSLRSRFGSVFTLRTTNGPMVVIGAAEELARVTQPDPGGRARRGGTPPRPAAGRRALGVRRRR